MAFEYKIDEQAKKDIIAMFNRGQRIPAVKHFREKVKPISSLNGWQWDCTTGTPYPYLRESKEESNVLPWNSIKIARLNWLSS